MILAVVSSGAIPLKYGMRRHEVEEAILLKHAQQCVNGGSKPDYKAIIQELGMYEHDIGSVVSDVYVLWLC